MAGRPTPLFPLPGAILLPGLSLPLHIFEPRYRAMIGHALATDRRIGMVQPREAAAKQSRPALYDIGGLGRIADVEALEDGRYNILLEGEGLFRIAREIDVTTPFRQAEVEMLAEEADVPLAPATRAALENEAKRFAIWLGYRVDWDGVAQLDDQSFVNAIAQVAPFDLAVKQALLEAGSMAARAELEMQMMRFMTSRRDGGGDRVTLQ
ncbi:MAG: LON peptidase substrate-binding domain-containing protein [Sphingomonadaceae bacterium]|nr:LON peptidase substrate-binding domain-containing protein [Sphingomonadaceae bacterium]